MTNQLTIANITIRQDAEGRYCLNDLHRAAGGEPKHRPSRWLENQQTRDLIGEIEGEAGIPALVSFHGGKTPGTFACKELFYAYAMWISPAFHLKVIRAYDELQTQGIAVAEHAALRRRASSWVMELVNSSDSQSFVTLLLSKSWSGRRVSGR